MKNIKKIIKEKMNEYLNENSKNSLQNILVNVGDKYSREWNRTPQELNAGLCEDIADDVIEKIGGETSDTFIIDDGWFWDSTIVSRYKSKSGDYWRIKNLKKYGEPPFGYDKLKELDLEGHTWIFSNGKHYDIEATQGVDNFWYLPIYQRQLSRLGLI